jgi:hypothetical protein
MKYLLPLLLLSTAALAEEESAPSPRCAKAEKIHQYLDSEYGEIPFATFKDQQGRDLVMYLSPKTSTWSVLQIYGSFYCGISSGTDFKPAEQKDYEKYKEKKSETPM